MKIAIAVDENKEAVCVSFGRAPYFLIHVRTGACGKNYRYWHRY